MNIKKFLTILFFTALSSAFFSIKANMHEEVWDERDHRSVSLFLFIEENDLYIYSTKQWDNIGVEMIDPNGTAIYMDVITIPAEEELTISFSYLPEGNYQVILTKDNQPVVWYLSK